MFRKAYNKTGQVVILLREQDGSEKNPFGFEQRVEQISEGLRAEGFEIGVDYDIVRVPNITHITYGRDVGYTIEQEFLGAEIEAISATEIRKNMK